MKLYSFYPITPADFTLIDFQIRMVGHYYYQLCYFQLHGNEPLLLISSFLVSQSTSLLANIRQIPQ